MVAAPPTIDPLRYRAVLGRYPTGVTVVTAIAEVVGDDGTLTRQPIGTTVNSFTSISLDPPLVLIAVGAERTIHPVIAASRRFAVNILDEENTELSDCFAGAPSALPREAFCNAAHREASGLPILEAALAYVVCELERVIEAGDHTLYLGRIVDLGARESDSWPLLYFRGRYLRIEHAETAELLGKPDAT
ncbi:MAG: flavin reductase family protein [Candidatus Limnocylindrales bacterium]